MPACVNILNKRKLGVIVNWEMTSSSLALQHNYEGGSLTRAWNNIEVEFGLGKVPNCQPANESQGPLSGSKWFECVGIT